MSVPISKREQSKAEFVNTAYDLHVLTIRICTKMDKRLTFFLGQPMCLLAGKCHEHAKSANSVFPRNKMDAQLRRDHLTEANCAVQALYSFLDIAYGLHQVTKGKITDNELMDWLDTAAREAKLISGVKEDDVKRFKNLPDGPL